MATPDKDASFEEVADALFDLAYSELSDIDPLRREALALSQLLQTMPEPIAPLPAPKSDEDGARSRKNAAESAWMASLI